jgi:hypothetical protein
MILFFKALKNRVSKSDLLLLLQAFSRIFNPKNQKFYGDLKNQVSKNILMEDEMS